MTGWLQLTADQRRETLTQAQVRTGIGTKALEKDWWVTLVLKALFQGAFSQHLVFKGGTSLSKGWKLINRFSEDIDIALDPKAFGMEYKEVPNKKYVNELRRTGCLFTSADLLEDLNGQLRVLGVPGGMLTIFAEPIPADFPDMDPQTIYVKYPPLYDPNPYMADEVKIEVSVRSLRTPFTTRQLISMLSEVFPNKVYEETAFPASVVEPRKTFLEKAFLLHEEFSKPDKTKIRHERMSRHFYDLVMTMDSGVGTEALADHDLYDHLIEHRRGYSRIPWVHYDSHFHPTINFIPPDELAELYKTDYATMTENMIYGENIPTFEELVSSLKNLQGRIRLKKEQRSLMEIIEIAMDQAKKLDGEIVKTTVVYKLDPTYPESPINNNTSYAVKFYRKGTFLEFEAVSII